MMIFIVGGVLLLGMFMVWVGMTQHPATAARAPSGPLGGVSCGVFPPFVRTMGFSVHSTLDTSNTREPGMWLSDPDTTDPGKKRYQHPSWASAGFLGAFTRDEKGNIYTIPAPQTNLELNKPEEQNIVYKIDGTTGIMTPFVRLPAARSPTDNPFGAMGLAVDCDTHSLYVTSVAGSTRTEEVGRIFRVDLQSAAVTSQIEGVDGFAAGVYNGARGKRLYFSLAREALLRSIALDKDGNFLGTPREEFDFHEQLMDGTGKARKLTWSRDGSMVLTISPFIFSLLPPDSTQQLVFRYNAPSDQWNIAEQQ